MEEDGGTENAGTGRDPDCSAPVLLALKGGSGNPEPYNLISYAVEERAYDGDKERTVVWRDDQNNTIRHMIPKGTVGIPYTFHSNHPLQPACKNKVAFKHYGDFGNIRNTGNLKHRFRFGEPPGRVEWFNAEYSFPCEKLSRIFQSDVRNRTLLGTFDTETISEVHTRMGLRRSTEYSKSRPIKLWRKYDTTLTFFAHMEAVKYQCHYQFPLQWFNRHAELYDTNKLVLKFNRPEDVQNEPEESLTSNQRRHSSWSRLVSWNEGSSRRRSDPSHRPALLHGDRLSLPDQAYHEWNALEIQFTHEGDAENFIYTCLHAKDESYASSYTTSPHPTIMIPVFRTGGDNYLFGTTSVSPGTNPRRRDSLDSSFIISTTSPLQPEDLDPGSAASVVPVLPPAEPQGISEMKVRSAKKWWNDFVTHRKRIFPLPELPDSVVPVKIAVVDTGIDATNPIILESWRNKVTSSVDRYRDFLSEDDSVAQPAKDSRGYSTHEVSEILRRLGPAEDTEPLDISGHGTHLAGIVLQLVPNATLFVARVLENNQEKYDVGAASRRVALAILNAVCTWKVNVINLSIGFNQNELRKPERRILHDALDFAWRSNVVIFAAASNSGNREELAYPASERHLVFCMNSTDGNGGRSWFNPQHQVRHDNFSILGEHVLSTWLQNNLSSGAYLGRQGAALKRDQGTSIACTIAACVAVLVYQFGRQYAVDMPEILETPQGLSAILGMMSRRTSDGFYDIVPWVELFHSKHNVDQIKALIDMKLSRI